MSGASGFICLLTDFSSSEPFAGIMKGAVYSVFPRAVITDLSHDLPKYDIRRAAAVLRDSYRFFPDGTVFVCVVDPGVGSRRRAIALKTDRFFFLAPDNGLLSHVMRENPGWAAFSLDRASFFMGQVSSTFHGRDIFAPCAAHIASGCRIEDMGTRIDDPEFFEDERPDINLPFIRGRVCSVDCYGNMATNISESDLQGRTDVRISLGKYSISGISPSYYDGRDSAFCAVINGSGFLEIASYRSSAASMFDNPTELIIEAEVS